MLVLFTLLHCSSALLKLFAQGRVLSILLSSAVALSCLNRLHLSLAELTDMTSDSYYKLQRYQSITKRRSIYIKSLSLNRRINFADK